MSTPPDLFRREAVLSHVGQARAGRGGLVLSPAWARYAYYLLVALSIALAVLAVFARVDEAATGPAAVTAGAVVAAFPAAVRTELRRGMPIRIEDDRGEHAELRIESIDDALADAAWLTKTFGAPGALAAQRGPVIVVHATAPASAWAPKGTDVAAPRTSTATVTLRTERIATALLPGLRPLLERRPAGTPAIHE